MNHPDPEARQTLPHASQRDLATHERFAQLLATTPIPTYELIDQLTLYLRQQTLNDLLALAELYRMVLPIPGVIMEFGVHRGRHLATLTALRGIYEPYNPHRRIIGFDTFTRLPEPTNEDLPSPAVAGRFAVPDSYPAHLRDILEAHEDTEQFHHIQRTFVVEGDVGSTLPDYLGSNAQTVIALAYFDLDLYQPTREVLHTLRPYLTQGSILAFDQLGHAKWPGETAALRDTLGLDCTPLRLLPGHPTPVYLRWPGSPISPD
jgi:hypothetical protein